MIDGEDLGQENPQRHSRAINPSRIENAACLREHRKDSLSVEQRCEVEIAIRARLGRYVDEMN